MNTAAEPLTTQSRRRNSRAGLVDLAPIEPSEPIGPLEVPDEPSDLDEFDLPDDGGDDSRWDVFVADDDERDPLPEPNDFWIDEPSD